MRWLLLVMAIMMLGSGCERGRSNAANLSDGEAQNFESRFANGVAVIYFYSTSCVQCSTQDKQNPAIINDLDKLGVAYVKVHPNNATIRKYNLSKFPTLIVFKDGREFHRWTGVVYPDMMAPVVKRALGQPATTNHRFVSGGL